MRVAVLGAGYAGLTVARRLERRLPEEADLVVVDDSGTHLVQHELHRVVRRPSLAEAITVPLSAALGRAEIRRARVVDVDSGAGVATLETDGAGAGDGDRERLSYDAAAVCLGAETAFHGVPGAETHARPLKRLDDAEAIRADATSNPGGDAVVVGAGLSGVQAAGELAALSREAELGLDVTVLEAADRVAPAFDDAFAGAVRTELDARGIAVETDATVEAVEETTVALADGRTVPHDVLVWAGGIRGPGALDGERRRTGADLRVGETGATFAVGDAAAVVDEAGAEAPASAQTAVRQARTAAENVLRAVGDDDPLDDYRHETAGWVVTVGDGAVARVGPAVVSGDPARALKAVIGAGHLGSVGAVEAATTLVREELDWPDADALDPAVAAAVAGAVPTDAVDPSTLGALGRHVLGPTVELSTAALGEGTVDLTGLTRPADRNHPGAPVNRLFRGPFDPGDEGDR
jgi:NADH dehydrogenase